MLPQQLESLGSFSHVFFDFDGVLQDTIEIKGHCFVDAFCEAIVLQDDQREAILNLHYENLSLNRIKKIELMAARLADLSGIAHDLVELREVVLDSYAKLWRSKMLLVDLVPGCVDLLTYLTERGVGLSVCSAMPHVDLDKIIRVLDIDNFFDRWNGWPVSKEQHIANVIDRGFLEPIHCGYIGDGLEDLSVALRSGVNFFLKRHEFNREIEVVDASRCISDFIIFKSGNAEGLQGTID
jgi:phosphoglycolate phosphatase-like HAD superfamily hydrolase